MRIVRTSLHRDLGVVDDADRDPPVDLMSLFVPLSDVIRVRVDSYCGASITLVHDGYPVTVICLELAGKGRLAAVAVSSLAVPVDAFSGGRAGVVVLFASTAGAFVDVAADLVRATRSDPSAFVLDADLDRFRPDPADGPTGFSVINRAVGFLMAEGATAEGARARLEQIAGARGSTLVAAAEAILTGGHRDPLPPGADPTSRAA